MSLFDRVAILGARLSRHAVLELGNTIQACAGQTRWMNVTRSLPKPDRVVPTWSVSDASVDEEVGIAKRGCELVLHIPRDQSIRVPPHQERRLLDERELGHVVVPEESRERLLPDVCRDLEKFRHEQVDQPRRDVRGRRLNDERARKVRANRIVQVGNDGLDEVEQLGVVPEASWETLPGSVPATRSG